MRRWWLDIALGLRLAVGGSRGFGTAWVRLAVGALGVALALVLLLGAASIDGMREARSARQSAAEPAHGLVIDGVDPLYLDKRWTQFEGRSIDGQWLYPSSATSPVPPGLARNPRPGEVMMSPAMAELLDSEDGALLRPRFDGLRRAGEVDDAGLVTPGDLLFYVGTDASLRRAYERWHSQDGHDGIAGETVAVYAFGGAVRDIPLPTFLVLLVIVGTAVLLVPVLVFVASSTRIAGAERDRRLAALRLVGADARQVRRIAAAESLLPAVLGMALGGALFLLIRPLVEGFRFMGVSVFAEDIRPSAPLVAVIVLAVPAIAVLTALVAMRRTVFEPLGVTRAGKPSRRRVSWRLVVLAAGVLLLIFPQQAWSVVPRAFDELGESWRNAVVAGTCLLLFGIGLLLPAAVEAAIARVRGGAPSWQLAIRRLQLDSGTSSRVISGVVIVLAGAIGLQLVLASAAAEVRRSAERVTSGYSSGHGVMLSGDGAVLEAAAERVRKMEGIVGASRVSTGYFSTEDGDEARAVVAECAVLTRLAGTADCRDGDTYLRRYSENDHAVIHAGQLPGTRLSPGERASAAGRMLTIPPDAVYVDGGNGLWEFEGDLLLTPSAARSLFDVDRLSSLVFVSGPAVEGAVTTEAMERMRNAIGLRTPPPWISGGATPDGYIDAARDFIDIRNILLALSVFVLVVAALSVLVTAVEQVRERRHALAAIAASGVGFGTLARSILWQSAVPLGVGTVLASLGGGLLGHLVLRLANTPLAIDWVPLAATIGAAVLLVMSVTVLSLPMLRAAVSVRNLRTE